MRADACCLFQSITPEHKPPSASVSLSVRPYLSKVPDVKKVKGLEQLAFLHAECVAARCQESPDVLQAQELRREERKGFMSNGEMYRK